MSNMVSPAGLHPAARTGSRRADLQRGALEGDVQLALGEVWPVLLADVEVDVPGAAVAGGESVPDLPLPVAQRRAGQVRRRTAAEAVPAVDEPDPGAVGHPVGGRAA